MGHRTLERVYVRMLFDPAFVDAVYASAEVALADLELSEAERAGLVRVDRRAWAHDALRRYRTLRTLAEEYQASTTLLLAATRSLASLDAFFSAREFHDAVQGRGSLALAFADFMERVARERCPVAPHLGDVLRLERLRARCRRALDASVSPAPLPERVDARTELALAPGHGVGRFNANVVEAVNVAERYLFEVGLMPAVALCEDSPRLAELPPVATEAAYLLAMPSASGIVFVPLDADYFAVLDAFATGSRPLGTAALAAVEAGVAREDVDTMVESLLEEGVLVAAATASSRTESRTPDR